MHNLYKSDRNDSARYILGNNGQKKLLVVGLNPSTATKEKSDTTVSKVKRVAEKNGYDGFVMLNLYPLRSTKPTNLPHRKDDSLIKENLNQIIKLAKTESKPHFWAAWGHNILLRTYLVESLQKLSLILKKINAKWFYFGSLTCSGHPRHPSRLSYSWGLHAFKIERYIERLNRENFIPLDSNPR